MFTELTFPNRKIWRKTSVLVSEWVGAHVCSDSFSFLFGQTHINQEEEEGFKRIIHQTRDKRETSSSFSSSLIFLPPISFVPSVMNLAYPMIIRSSGFHSCSLPYSSKNHFSAVCIVLYCTMQYSTALCRSCSMGKSEDMVSLYVRSRSVARAAD